jgi:hypothetical protein
VPILVRPCWPLCGDLVRTGIGAPSGNPIGLCRLSSAWTRKVFVFTTSKASIICHVIYCHVRLSSNEVYVCQNFLISVGVIAMWSGRYSLQLCGNIAKRSHHTAIRTLDLHADSWRLLIWRDGPFRFDGPVDTHEPMELHITNSMFGVDCRARSSGGMIEESSRVK